jgi:hypothetical protein
MNKQLSAELHSKAKSRRMEQNSGKKNALWPLLTIEPEQNYQKNSTKQAELTDFQQNWNIIPNTWENIPSFTYTHYSKLQ